MKARFATVEEVIRDPLFPAVDVALRRGRHIDREDGDSYAFVSDAQDHLELLYRRYGCELVTQSDGYFYLLPTGEQLSRRQLSAGEMLIGQTLALQYLDPATLQAGGMVTKSHLLSRLVSLVGDRELAKVLEPRRRRFDDERIVHEIIRRKVGESIRRLESLGFIDVLDEDHIRLRSPLLRFADPVRGLSDVGAAMERLVARGEIVDLDLGAAETESEGIEETPDEVESDELQETGEDEEAEE